MAGKIACLFCGFDYEQKTRWQKFCSTSCADKYRYHSLGTRKINTKIYQEKNKVKIREQAKNNPNKKYIQWKAKLKRNFGLSPEMYMEMYNSQNGKCKICSDDIKIIHRNTHIDHCHETGVIRGLLCSNCNLGLGHFRDNSIFLLNAITYLGE